MNIDLCELFNVKEDELFSLTNFEGGVYRVHNNELQVKLDDDVDGDFTDSYVTVNNLTSEDLEVIKILTNEEKIKTISGELNEFCKSRNVQLFVEYECKEFMSIIITNLRITSVRPYIFEIKLDDVKDIDRTMYTLLRNIDEHFTSVNNHIKWVY